MRTLQKIIRGRAVEAYVGLKHSQTAELVKAGKFPKPIKLSDNGRAIGWLESDLIEWQASRVAARDRDVA
jgi:prophage regulatory protein